MKPWELHLYYLLVSVICAGLIAALVMTAGSGQACAISFGVALTICMGVLEGNYQIHQRETEHE